MLLTSLWRRIAALFLLAGSAALLSSCFIAPGRFVSALDIRDDGHFTFTYNGEIHMLALSKLAQQGEDEAFSESSCYDDDAGESRPCSEQEIASQREAWQDGKAERAASRKREAEKMRAFMGGIDFSDPKAAQELTERLQRQRGWKRVEYKGDGLFMVNVEIVGTLDHDFAFPTIERFPGTNPFVQIALRQDGTVRMDAPAFSASANDPMQMMALGKSLAPADSETGKAGAPVLDGRFTLTTNGAVLANNTDEGPQASANGKQLEWRVGVQGQAAPMALVQLAR